MKKMNMLVMSMLLLLIAACTQQAPTVPAGEENGNGRVVFAITDAAAEMGAVSSVKVTVDNIKVHSAAKG